MKTLLALAACLSLLPSKAQAQAPSFSTILYNDTIPFQSACITNAPGGGSVVVGNASGSGLVMRLDSIGLPVWHSMVGSATGVPYVELRAVISTADSGYLVTGNYNGLPALFRFNAIGDTVWTKSLDVPGFGGTGYSLHRTFDNGFLYAGKIANNNPPYGWVVVALFDSTAALQWSHVMTDSAWAQSVTARQVPDSGFIVQLSGSYCTLAKLSSSGTLLWSKKYSDAASSFSTGSGLAVAHNGFIVTNYMYNRCAVFKTDWNGNPIWCTLDSSFMPFGMNNGFGPIIQPCHDSGFSLLHCGGFGSELIRFDSTGNLLWASYVATVASDLVITSDSNYLVAGSGPLWAVRPVGGTPVISPSVNILKLNSVGLGTYCTGADTLMSFSADTIISVPVSLASFLAGTIGYAPVPYAPVILTLDTGCVGMSAGIAEQTFAAGISVYPVPATGSVTVSSKMKLSKEALCKVFDLSGRELIRVTAHNTSFQVSLEALHEGMYLLVLFDERGIVSRKIIKQ